MTLSRIIRARVGLPCSIRFSSPALRTTRGITEELTRESLVVIAFSAIPVARLGSSTPVSVAIDLPHSGQFRPRVLECAATVSGVCLVDSGLRISAAVGRMSIKDREPGNQIPEESESALYGFQPFAAVEGSRNIHRVVHQNHLTNKTQGEHSMSFLKKLFVEEDGQDMVEYGLVIALVVLAAGATLTLFNGSITGGFTAIGTKVTNDIK